MKYVMTEKRKVLGSTFSFVVNLIFLLMIYVYHFYMLPKFYQPTIDYRYIAAAIKSSLKVLAKILTGVFKLADTPDKTLKYMDHFKFKFKNPSGYWVAKNKDSTLYNLNYLNNSARSVCSFDFKKLDTNLPHGKVIETINDLLERCFKDKKAEFICINNKSYFASWYSVAKKNCWTYKLDELKEFFSFLLDNIYVKFRGKIYKQVVGIPMGCDCAPLVADLFLHWYEHDFISRGVMKFTTRYIDDLNTPNISINLVNVICNDIYRLHLLKMMMNLLLS